MVIDDQNSACDHQKTLLNGQYDHQYLDVTKTS